MKQSLTSHITPRSVEFSNIIMIPIHINNNHWALLVCNLADRVWEFYDSLSNPTHKSFANFAVYLFFIFCSYVNLIIAATLTISLFEMQVEKLWEDCSDSFSADIRKWPVMRVDDVPQQVDQDCGVFVIKFMKILYSKQVVDWKRWKDMHKKIAKYRAKYAADILRAFGVPE